MIGGNSFGSAYYGQIYAGGGGNLIAGRVTVGDIQDMYPGGILQPETGRIRGANGLSIEESDCPGKVLA